MKKQPGVMLYFEVLPSLSRLSWEEKGRLFQAILEYGAQGTEPQLEGMVGVVWDFVRPRIDTDRSRYEQTCERRKRSALSRWETL